MKTIISLSRLPGENPNKDFMSKLADRFKKRDALNKKAEEKREEQRSWFDELSDEAQEKYLEEHPGSQLKSRKSKKLDSLASVSAGLRSVDFYEAMIETLSEKLADAKDKLKQAKQRDKEKGKTSRTPTQAKPKGAPSTEQSIKFTQPTEAELKRFAKHSGLPVSDKFGNEAHKSLMAKDKKYAANHVHLEKEFKKTGEAQDLKRSEENTRKLTAARIKLMRTHRK